jgi:hypothetical protein
VNDLKERIDGLIELGVRNFLWFRQGPFMLQWRRGVRGLEYCTLKVLMDEAAALISGTEPAGSAAVIPSAPSRIEEIAASTEAQLARVREILLPFVEEARLLLLLERRAMLREKLTFESANDPHIREVRERLFSLSKSHGGLFKEVVDRMDALLYSLLTF